MTRSLVAEAFFDLDFLVFAYLFFVLCSAPMCLIALKKPLNLHSSLLADLFTYNLVSQQDPFLTFAA